MQFLIWRAELPLKLCLEVVLLKEDITVYFVNMA